MSSCSLGGIMLTPPDYSTLEGPPPSYEESIKPKEDLQLGEEAPAPPGDQTPPIVIGSVPQPKEGSECDTSSDDPTLAVMPQDSNLVRGQENDQDNSCSQERLSCPEEVVCVVNTQEQDAGGAAHRDDPQSASEEPPLDNRPINNEIEPVFAPRHINVSRSNLTSESRFQDYNDRPNSNTRDIRFRSLQDLRHINDVDVDTAPPEISVRHPSWHRSMQSLDLLQRAARGQAAPTWSLKEMSDTEV